MTMPQIRIALLACVFTGTVAVAAPPPLTLRAGAAMVDITPAPATLEHGDTIRDPLFVRAIMVSNGITCAMLVGLDQPNAHTAIVVDATARAASALGCPAQNFLISATHTHCASTHGLAETGLPTPKQVADAIVSAAMQAKARLRPARIGFGTTRVDLNVNRDAFEDQKWFQGSNRQGASDKTLAVIEFLGEDGEPIGVYMNYAMHAIDFYLSGVISADFPGEASRYVERRFPGAVAVFTQGASGDQNPLLTGPMQKLSGIRTQLRGPGADRIDAPDPWKAGADTVNANAVQANAAATPLAPSERAAYTAALEETSEVVTAMGAILGESALDVMRNLTPDTSASGAIWAGQRSFTCPGRARADQPALTPRQNFLPPYKDADPIELKVGLLRIADVDFASVDAELYSEIGMRLKARVPSTRTMLVTIANGKAQSGYIPSNAAGNHLTFEAIGSKLKPGCAEDRIVAAELDLFAASARAR